MITAKFSPLKLEQFALLNTQYDFGTPKENEKLNAQELFQSYRVDVEFDHFFDEYVPQQFVRQVFINNHPSHGFYIASKTNLLFCRSPF